MKVPPKPATLRGRILKLFDTGAYKSTRELAEMLVGGPATRQQVRYVIQTLTAHRPDWQRRMYGEDWWAARQQAVAAQAQGNGHDQTA